VAFATISRTEHRAGAVYPIWLPAARAAVGVPALLAVPEASV